MKIALITKHARGGVVRLANAVCTGLRELGHDVWHEAARTPSIHNYDIIHFFNAQRAAIAKTGQPFTVTIHHMTCGYEQGYLDALRSWCPDRVHVLDRFTQRDLGRRGVFNVTYIPMTLDLEYDPLPYPDEFTVGYLGGDAQFKRYDVIRKAAESVGIRCVGHESEPWLSDADIRALYTSMSAYVVASYEDGGPIPPLEALMHGRPVITTYVGNMPNYVVDGYNGIYHDGTVRGLAAAMLEMRSGYDAYVADVQRTAPSMLSPCRNVAQRYVRMWEDVCGK